MKKLILCLLILGMIIPNLGNAQISHPFTMKDLADVKTVLGQTESAVIYWDSASGLWLASSNGGDGLPFLDFDIIPTIPAHKEGRVHWDDDSKCLEYDTELTGTHIQIGQETVLRAYNDTGVDIQEGVVVRLSGASGSKPTVALANATVELESYAVGITTSIIEDTKSGYVTTYGIVHDIDTTGADCVDGVTAWLSPTAGEIKCGLPPVSPLHAVHIGKVLVANATSGDLLVSPINGYELEELHNVASDITTSASIHDTVQWNGSDLWVGVPGTIHGETTGLTDASSNDILVVTLVGPATAGLLIVYTITATNGTAYQSHTGVTLVSLYNVTSGGTADGAAQNNIHVTAGSTGTLTDTWGVTSGTDQVTITLTPSSSLTTTALSVKYRVRSLNENVVTPQ